MLTHFREMLFGIILSKIHTWCNLNMTKLGWTASTWHNHGRRSARNSERLSRFDFIFLFENTELQQFTTCFHTHTQNSSNYSQFHSHHKCNLQNGAETFSFSHLSFLISENAIKMPWTRLLELFSYSLGTW